MAAESRMGAIVEQEREIPMLTVVKNNAVLKNIFLITAPDSHREDSGKIRQDLEQTLLVGRHPICQIRLEHPSISRFHLRIHTKSSLKRLSVTDLSSVHGTWISGKRVKPNIRVDVNEGDTLTIGKSSRVYRLHWIAFQKASGLDNPVNALLVDDEKAKEEEVKIEGNTLLLENEAESTRSPKKASQVLVSNPPENSKEDEDVHLMICNNGDGNALEIEGEYSADSSSKVKISATNQFATLTELEHEIVLLSENEDTKPVESALEASKSVPQSPIIRTLEERKVLSVAPLLEAAVDFDMQFMNLALDSLIDENPLPVELGAMNIEKDGRICESSTGFISEEVIGHLEEGGEEYHQFVEDRGSSQDSIVFSESEESPNGPAVNYAKIPLFVDEASYRKEDQILFNDEEDDGAWSFWFLSSPETAPENNFINIDKETQGETEGEVERVERNFSEKPTSVKENCLWSFWSGNRVAGSANSSHFSEAEFGNEDRLVDGETIASITRELFTNPEDEYLTPGKGSHVNATENYTLKSPRLVVDQSLSASSNKENQTPKKFIEEHKKKPTIGTAQRRRPLQTLFVDSPQIQSSITMSAYSNKENQHTKTSKQALSVYGNQTQKTKSTQRLALHPLSHDSPQKNISGGASYSNNKNLTPKSLQKRKLAKEAPMIPFLPLFVGSPLKTSDDIHESVGSTEKHKCCEQRVKRWSMVVDMSCLVDKNSRKALQLLEGVKGTQLIIPATVVRELEFMKQQAGRFRRNRDAYSASQWIEECSVRSKGWIQIQTQTQTQKKEDEDEVVDYALYLKGSQEVEEEQLVILSDDVTMKIKAMAQGVICEGADEFRWSLVSPFSRRFLWVDSWPRGQTWSHLDDVVLRYHFYPSFNTTIAKGLKLVLLNQLEEQYVKETG